MVHTTREIERKYEIVDPGALPKLPGVLSATSSVAEVTEETTVALDAEYYDTPEQRLAADGITLRRRTGGGDAGWHLKLPVSWGVREEVRAPPADSLPSALAGLVRSRVRGGELLPLLRLRTERAMRWLRDASGEPLAEVAVDRVQAERGETVAEWTEVEVELADGRAEELLDELETGLLAAGLRRAAGTSKLQRGLAATAPAGSTASSGGTGSAASDQAGEADGKERKAKKAKKGEQGEQGESDNGKQGESDNKAKKAEKGKKSKKGERGKAGKEGKGQVEGERRSGKKAVVEDGTGTGSPTAGDYVLRYARAQVQAIVELDPAVRRDVPDSVHRMRVATRRLRSCFRSFRRVLDRERTDPLIGELTWLAAELGVDRDREVLTARLRESVDGLPRGALLGPVRGRLRTFSQARRSGSRRRLLAVLDGSRYLTLLDSLDALLADPAVLRPAAARPAEEVFAKAVRRDFGRLAAHVDAALAAPAGPDRDRSLHEARKAAKRTRYCVEAARPVFGRAARDYVRRMTALQDLLGEHQDSVVARAALREIAEQAHAAGEHSYSYGVLWEREVRRAAHCEERLPGLWSRVSEKKNRELH